MLRVAVHPADEKACGFYRATWPTLAVEDLGVMDAEVRFQYEYHAYHNEHGPVELVERPDIDVAVIQRPWNRQRIDLIRLLQKEGVAVVVDVDDNFEEMPRTNAAWRDATADHNPHWVKRACELADLVTVTTAALRNVYARHGRCVIIPNYVPQRYLDIDAPPPERLTLGWAGFMNVHTGDLEVTNGAIQEVVAASSSLFKVVGFRAGVQEELQLRDAPEETGWVPIGTYPRVLRESLSVGIVPLKLGAFNEAKSWLKGLEMAALGIPFVASATTPYQELASLGIGLVARRRRDWTALLKRMLIDELYRADLAALWRERAAKLTIERNAWRWAEAWQCAKENRQQAA